MSTEATTATTRHRWKRTREDQAIRAARAAIRELGDDASVQAVEAAVCERLGVPFGSTLVWTLHATVEAWRVKEAGGRPDTHRWQ